MNPHLNPVSNPVTQLPPFLMGPYHISFVESPKSAFHDKRRNLEHDWTRGIAHIREGMSSREALRCVFRSLVTAIHYRSGLNDRSNEESFTHSLATGMVELVLNNPVFSIGLHELMEQEWGLDAPLAAVCRGQVACEDLPQSVRFDGHVCEFDWIPGHRWKYPHFYGFYLLNKNRIEMDARLSGSNLALICLHEVIHFLHEKMGLKDKHTELQFKRGHVKMLIRFIRQNPQFWAWWLTTVQQAAHEVWADAA